MLLDPENDQEKKEIGAEKDILFSKPDDIQNAKKHNSKRKHRRLSQDKSENKIDRWKGINILDKNASIIAFPTGYEEGEYFCTPSTIRKWIILGLVLQLICLLATVVLWALIYFNWPMTFASEFQPGPLFLRNQYFVMLIGIEPLYNFIFLLVVLILAKKKKSIVRLYYQVSPWLLIFTLVLGLKALFFIGHFTKDDLRKKLTDTFISVDSWNDTKHEHAWTVSNIVAMKGWDDLQNYFECCGVDSDENWERRYLETDQTQEVPTSCCILQRSGHRMNCTHDPIPGVNTWKKGCLDLTYDLITTIGYTTTALCLLIILVTIFCVAAATEFYSSLRRGDGSGYEMNITTFRHEFCCYACICCQRLKGKMRKSKARIQPLGQVEDSKLSSRENNEIEIEGELELYSDQPKWKPSNSDIMAKSKTKSSKVSIYAENTNI